MGPPAVVGSEKANFSLPAIFPTSRAHAQYLLLPMATSPYHQSGVQVMDHDGKPVER